MPERENAGREEPDFSVRPDSALLVVDVQNDFCPGGSLAVAHGDAVVPVLNTRIDLFRRLGLPIAYTRDWHPSNHCSFREQRGPWPVHCVQHTPGADFHSGLKIQGAVFSKAFEPHVEAYSGFGGFRVDEAGKISGISLADWLRNRDVKHVYVGGLTTDYCVRTTSLDAIREHFTVTVLSRAIRGVNVQPGDDRRAIQEMKEAGAQFI